MIKKAKLFHTIKPVEKYKHYMTLAIKSRA